MAAPSRTAQKGTWCSAGRSKSKSSQASAPKADPWGFYGGRMVPPGRASEQTGCNRRLAGKKGSQGNNPLVDKKAKMTMDPNFY